MSLYNNVASSLSQASGLTSGLQGIIAGTANTITEQLGGGKLAKAMVQGAQGVANSRVAGLVNRYVPHNLQKVVGVGTRAGRDLLRGDWQGAALDVWKSGILGDFFPHDAGIMAQAAYWGVQTPLFGGLSAMDAKKIFDEFMGETLARKNLWLLEVTSTLQGGGLNQSDRWNMFATDIEYSPFIVEGDNAKIGGANVATVNGCGPVEMSITTLDDANGSIKRWFAAHHAAATAQDGTVGEPGKYAVQIKVVHNVLQPDSAAYEDIGLFRPMNLDITLSRQENAMEELQMTFGQLDTFMSA